MTTQRATQAEKAAAWDRLMASTDTDGDAILAAWQALNETVQAREAYMSACERTRGYVTTSGGTCREGAFMVISGGYPAR